MVLTLPDRKINLRLSPLWIAARTHKDSSGVNYSLHLLRRSPLQSGEVPISIGIDGFVSTGQAILSGELNRKNLL
jgi:hypothetical protein